MTFAEFNEFIELNESKKNSKVQNWTGYKEYPIQKYVKTKTISLPQQAHFSKPYLCLKTRNINQV